MSAATPVPIGVDELLRVTPAFCDVVAKQVRPCRRIAVGERVLLTFENRATILATLHHIMTTEGMTDRHALQAECDVYNGLLPHHGLTAALTICPIAGESPLQALTTVRGIEEHLWLGLGGSTRPAQFHAPLTLHQHVYFALDSADREALADQGVAVVLAVDVAHATAQVTLPPATRRALWEDLS